MTFIRWESSESTVGADGRIFGRRKGFCLAVDVVRGYARPHGCVVVCSCDELWVTAPEDPTVVALIDEFSTARNESTIVNVQVNPSKAGISTDFNDTSAARCRYEYQM